MSLPIRLLYRSSFLEPSANNVLEVATSIKAGRALQVKQLPAFNLTFNLQSTEGVSCHSRQGGIKCPRCHKWELLWDIEITRMACYDILIRRLQQALWSSTLKVIAAKICLIARDNMASCSNLDHSRLVFQKGHTFPFLYISSAAKHTAAISATAPTTIAAIAPPLILWFTASTQQGPSDMKASLWSRNFRDCRLQLG